jgi:hypothetical protein
MTQFCQMTQIVVVEIVLRALEIDFGRHRTARP